MGKISISSYYRTLCASLGETYSQQEAKSLANILLSKALGKTAHHSLVYGAETLNPSQVKEIEGYLSLLKLQKPIQYILGETNFFGINMHITPSVLIPRPETEELVDWIIKTNEMEGRRILDIGTGSGCIAIALAKNLARSKVYALDISTDALKLAQANAERAKVDIAFFEHDIINSSAHSIMGKPFDIIVSNPPYVRESEKRSMLRNVLDYEPHVALFVNDSDPLIFYKSIALIAIDTLSASGQIFCEINEALGNETAAVFSEYGFSDISIRKDINDKDRMIRCRRN